MNSEIQFWSGSFNTDAEMPFRSGPFNTDVEMPFGSGSLNTDVISILKLLASEGPRSVSLPNDDNGIYYVDKLWLDSVIF